MTKPHAFFNYTHDVNQVLQCYSACMSGLDQTLYEDEGIQTSLEVRLQEIKECL